MRGKRVLVSGMGSELGSLAASILESQDWVGALEGIDVDPPRRRLRRSVFHRVQPSNRGRVVDIVTRFNPHVVIHVAVWEPDARAGTTLARQLTDDAATSILGAAAECRALEHVIVRSAAEIYGRARGSVTRPDESAPANPTSEFGRMALRIEDAAADVRERAGVTVGALRLAPVLGPHVPSPLGRLLRMPIVPFSLLADPPFAVLRDLDAADALVAAARVGLDQPVNVCGPGAITAWQAIRRGRRLPAANVGPEWALTRRLSQLFGAPVPDHVVETLHRGRLIDGGRALELIGFTPAAATPDVIDSLYAWPSIVRVMRPTGTGQPLGAAS
ncbi:MAG TPA: NAD-dependent epimerase/dehydratase family protein [Ilumatobacteraceae bacterium]